MTIRRKRKQHGAGLGAILKIGIPILANMLGGSGRIKRRRRMMTRTIRRRRIQKGQGFLSKIGNFFDNIF